VFTLIQAGVPCKWINDSQRLLLEWFDVICDFPSQLYHLALLFCPPSSWLCKQYATELSQEVRVVRGLPAEWGECFRTVTLDIYPWAVACWKDIIAVGSSDGPIIILDGVTGSQKAVLPGHTGAVISVTFSSDGTSLVSGSRDETIKLWDVQTGGVVKTFHGHTNQVSSVTISADCTMIASGSNDKMIRLWDIQTGECLHVVGQQELVRCATFSPIDSQSLISISGGKAWQWNISGCKINPVHDESLVPFSLDRIQVVLCQGVALIVQHFNDSQLYHCSCLIPGSKLIAVAAGSAINIWNITGSDPHLIKTYAGQGSEISSLAFSSPSSLISSSYDKSVKLWQIGDFLTDPAVTDQNSTPLAFAPIQFIHLQATDGVAISRDSNWVVSIWDISTGDCKASFQVPAKECRYSDVQLVNSRLICVWGEEENVHIWDAEEGGLKTVGTTENDARGGVEDVKISGDGSRVYCLYYRSLQAWSVLTGEGIGEVKLKHSNYPRSLSVDGSRVWVHSHVGELQGWDFGISVLSPVKLSITPPALNNAKLWDDKLSGIWDADTRKVVFQLGGRFMKPPHVEWDGQYLVAGYNSGEVLILDFNHVLFW